MPHSGIVIFYRARPIGGEMQAGDDAQDVRIFPLDDLPENLAFRTHREVLERLIRSRSPCLQVDESSVTIRDARLEDEARLLALLPLIPVNAEMTPDDLQSVAQRFHESLAMDVLMAEVDGQVLGFVALSFIPVLSGLRALIDDLAVDPACRRQGIGQALVEAAIQRADRRGATHLFVDTSRGDATAREFYRASGFEAHGISPLHIR